MNKPLQGFLCLLLLSVFLISCSEKEQEEYYKAPEGLIPIYQQLELRGNFTNYLACVEKTSYKNVIDRTGYFTCFAPNDAAFEKFFTAQGSAEISEELANKIVAYSLIYNGFTRDQLADFQSNLGWVPASAFKRRTAYYSGVFAGKNFEGQDIKTLAGNWNGLNYIEEDNNNKYIPYFIDEFFGTKNLTATDYNYFYPNVPYKGFNVVDAQVVEADIRAENGIIHEIDNVILPLPSLEEYIASKPQYNKFKELLEKIGVTYFFSEAATKKNTIRTGKQDPVYIKSYSPLLAFAPGNESFYRVTNNDGQSDGYSMIVPNNDALEKYINEVLLEHYTEKNFDFLPNAVKMDFFNAHMWQTTLWPGNFGIANSLGEKTTINPGSDITEAKVLSNGIFYGSKKVHESDAFHSVFGKAYLNPRFSLMTKFLQRELRTTLTSPYINYTVFMLSDDVLREAGYNFSDSSNAWTFKKETNFATERLTRLINGHIAITRNYELDNLGGSGIVETYGGEFIKFENNQVYAGGNLEGTNQKVLVTSQKVNAKNGIVYFLDKPLLSPDSAVSAHIRKYPQFSKFNEYLRNSNLYIPATGDIDGTAVGSFYTFFIPSNDAIDAAITDGVLPANSKTTNSEEKIKISNFIQYHILNRVSIIPNGKETGRFESVLKASNGDPTVLEVKYEGGTLSVEDQTGRTAVVVIENSNVLATRAVLHQINTYLKYQ